jgi:GTP-binding protein
MMLDFVRHYNLHHLAVATTADKIPRSKLQAHISGIKNSLRLGPDVPVVMFSALAKQGRDELWEAIESRLGLKEGE